ncbi:uroporphyrinogen-III C-methyltransferase [Litoreibacter arenae]|uniref:uroporphyrinogen-III C-methyltransferase n=1 Tax=Litoreibacter arenae DSM 19593 TaxID=1123360 RepID=S9QG62_9RHOB|nr:uroporphyrinogen-III C-methyltransferase [Litoreibacter arenae]EPX78563.1 Uroporphyrinogen-III methyltransferase [Litoreibacter arenae DSM 19593]
MTPNGKVYLIGAGPGDPDLMTLRAVRMLGDADVVVYDRLVSPEILAMAPKSADMVPVGKAPKCHTVPQDQINEILAERALEGQIVARLKGGDPMIFGRGSEEAAYLQARGINVEYAPGISAAQGMAAATGVPLTHRGLATGVRYVTGHLAADKTLKLNWESLADIDTTLVVYMGASSIAEIALRLMSAGLPANLPVLAVSNVTTPRETRLLSHLGQIGVDAQTLALRTPVLFVIGRVVSLYQQAALNQMPPLPAAIAGE